MCRLFLVLLFQIRSIECALKLSALAKVQRFFFRPQNLSPVGLGHEICISSFIFSIHLRIKVKIASKGVKFDCHVQDRQRQNIAGNHHIQGQKRLHACGYSGPRSLQKTYETKIFFFKKKKLQTNNKSSNYGLRVSQDGCQTLHPLAKFFT